MRNELRDTNIHISCVHPGGVNTNMQKAGVHSADAGLSAEKLAAAMTQMSPERAADIILKSMAKGKKRILVGRDVKLTDIIARLFPTAYDRIIAKYV